VSADSRQVYRGLRIGTAQPTDDEREHVPHHLIDFLPLEERYSAQRFVDDCLPLLRAKPEAPPLLVGGTGFYLRSLWEGLFPLDVDPERLAAARAELEELDTAALAERLATEDPESAGRLHPNDRQRVIRALEVKRATGRAIGEHQRAGRHAPEGFEWRRVWLTRERGELRERIARRTEAMLAAGWLEELRALLDTGADQEWPGLHSLGYSELLVHLRGECSLEEAAGLIVDRTRQYARRQDIWFGKEICEARIDAGSPDALERLRGLLDSPQGPC